MSRGKDLVPRKRRPTLPVADRLAKFTDKSGGPDACWPWIGAHTAGGYALIGIGKTNCMVSRITFEMAHGPIPEGFYVLHTCDNPACVNPAHLVAGTPKQNMQDMVAKGRASTGPHIPQKGEANHNAKLTVEQVIEMRRLFDAGMLRHELAAQFGCSWPTADDVCLRKTWRHV